MLWRSQFVIYDFYTVSLDCFPNTHHWRECDWVCVCVDMFFMTMLLFFFSLSQAQNQQFEGLVLESLEWIIRSDQDVGIRWEDPPPSVDLCRTSQLFLTLTFRPLCPCRLIGQVPEDPVTDINEISRLESTHPNMPFVCRFRRAFLTGISRVFVFLVGEKSKIFTAQT